MSAADLQVAALPGLAAHVKAIHSSLSLLSLYYRASQQYNAPQWHSDQLRDGTHAALWEACIQLLQPISLPSHSPASMGEPAALHCPHPINNISSPPNLCNLVIAHGVRGEQLVGHN